MVASKTATANQIADVRYNNMLGIIGVLKYFNLLDAQKLAVSDVFTITFIIDQVLHDGVALEQNCVSFEESIFNYDLQSVSEAMLRKIKQAATIPEIPAKVIY